MILPVPLKPNQCVEPPGRRLYEAKVVFISGWLCSRGLAIAL